MEMVKAAHAGDTRTVRALLRRGEHPDAVRDHHNRTALHWACFEGHQRVISMLMDAHADPNVTDDNMRTPLHGAARWGLVPSIRLLLAAGADVNKQDVKGWSALHFAAKEGNLDAGAVLVEGGACVAAANEDGLSALQLAAAHDHDRFVRVVSRVAKEEEEGRAAEGAQ